MSELTQKRCLPCEGGVAPLSEATAKEMLAQLPHWQLQQQHGHLELMRYFHFKNFYQTMAFVNAIAWMAHQEDHHPDLEVGYNYCRVRYSTHAIKGLSENDFICAAKVSALMTDTAC